MKDDVMEKLLKKATGYLAKETTEEYVIEDGKKRLVKQKVAKKQVPPDVSALKIYMEMVREKEVAAMSDEELRAEKARLLRLLKEDDGEKGVAENNEG